MRKGIIIQARLGSSRLPNKILLPLAGKPALQHVVERMKQVRGIDEVIIATTDLPSDDPIVEFAEHNNYPYFRGSEEDVLSRYYHTAKTYDLDIIVRITSDCPLIDPEITSKIVEYFDECQDADMVTNGGSIKENRTFPRGLDVSVFSMEALKQAHNNAKTISEREHVTLYIYNHCNVNYYKQKNDLSHYRLTLDTQEDYELISKIYENLYQEGEIFGLQETINFLRANPELLLINKNIIQKEV